MFEYIDKKKIFKYGKEGYKEAVSQAISCKRFVLDKDEDELITSTDKNSCYNCLYRRWTQKSFMCMAK